MSNVRFGNDTPLIQAGYCNRMSISAKKSDWPVYNDESKPRDLFVQADGFAFAGRHLLFDCWNASNLDNVGLVEKALNEAVSASGSNVVHMHLHHTAPDGGVTGVAVLPESHISIHTWPERNYAAIDVFMCGDTRPERALPIFKEAFHTQNIEVSEHMRGRQFTDMTAQCNIKEEHLEKA